MGVQMKDQVSSRSQRVRAPQLKADMDGPEEGPRPPEAVFEADTLMMMMQVGGTATIGETAEKMLSKSVLLLDTFWATHSRAAANGVTDAPEKGGVVACPEGPGHVSWGPRALMGVGQVSSRSQRVRAQLEAGILTLTCSWVPGALMGVQMKDQVSPRSQLMRAKLKADIDGPWALMRLHM
jgi:hypothetical protein